MSKTLDWQTYYSGDICHCGDRIWEHVGTSHNHYPVPMANPCAEILLSPQGVTTPKPIHNYRREAILAQRARKAAAL